MPDYSKGKIYKIISDKANLCYIGSTREKYLSNRMSGHRADFKRFKNSKGSYCTSFKVLEHDDAQIILIEKYPCECKYELEARERYWIERLECCNKYIPTRTRKEYSKEYNQRPEVKANNREYKKKYRQKPEVKAKMREYNQRPEVKVSKKEYNQRPEVKAYRSEKITCDFCGRQSIRSKIRRHQKSKYCQSFQQENPQEI